MPIKKSAIKAAKRNLLLRQKNLIIKTNMKNSIKRVVKAKNTGELSEEMVRIAYSKIDKALKAGIIKKNTAARKKSRVARLLYIQKLNKNQ